MNTFESLKRIFTTSSEIEEPLTDEEIDLLAQFCFILFVMFSQFFLCCLMNTPSEQNSPTDQAPANEDNDVRNVDIEMPPVPVQTNEPATTSRKVYSSTRKLDVWYIPKPKNHHVRRLFNDEDSED